MFLLFLACSASPETATLILRPPERADTSAARVPPPAEPTEDESALSNFLLHLNRIVVGRPDRIGMEWVTIYDGKSETWDVDLVTGEGDELEVEIPAGEWDHLLIDLEGYEWRREGVGCTWQENTDSIVGLATTATNAVGYGQHFDVHGVPITEPTTAPEDVHPNASDAMFWQLSGTIEVDEGDVQYAWLSAASEGPLTEHQPCDEGPGKPPFVLDVDEYTPIGLCLLTEPHLLPVMYDTEGWRYEPVTPESHCADLDGAYQVIDSSDFDVIWYQFLVSHGAEPFFSLHHGGFEHCWIDYYVDDWLGMAMISNYALVDADGEFFEFIGPPFEEYCNSLQDGSEPYAMYFMFE